jgi:hypothetical protein
MKGSAEEREGIGEGTELMGKIIKTEMCNTVKDGMDPD